MSYHEATLFKIDSKEL